MDKFTRIYTIVLAVAAVAGLVWIFYEPPGVGKLNDALAANAELREYPYRFRVLRLDDGVATMTTPRSAEFPAWQAIGLLYPSLKNEPADSPAMVEAEQNLARVQGMASEIVLDAGGVDRVAWELDRNWLFGKGIDPDRL